jgi:hypothetical protein
LVASAAGPGSTKVNSNDFEFFFWQNLFLPGRWWMIKYVFGFSESLRPHLALKLVKSANEVKKKFNI